jgi:hypothetical protein
LGRQSDFSREKLAYLDGLAKDFQNCKDCGTFYDKAVQGLIERFGYTRDGKAYVGADSLTAEERSEYYQALHNVSVHISMKMYWRAYTEVG